MFKNQGELLVEELECHIFCFFSMRIEKKKKITRKIVTALQNLGQGDLKYQVSGQLYTSSIDATNKFSSI